MARAGAGDPVALPQQQGRLAAMPGTPRPHGLVGHTAWLMLYDLMTYVYIYTYTYIHIYEYMSV